MTDSLIFAIIVYAGVKKIPQEQIVDIDIINLLDLIICQTYKKVHN